MNELYKRYRPKTLKGIVGQEGAMASLEKLLSKGLPHAILLTGPSGCGKTTIARILKELLHCGDPDYQEIDCAVVESPIEQVRRLHRVSHLAPMAGDCRVFFLEEAQSLSRAGFSQQGLLKLIEDVPPHAYFILAASDPQKLHRAVHTRCSEVKLVALKPKSLERVIRRVMDKEGMTLSDEMVGEIVEASDGSARKALVILEQVGSLETEEEQSKAIQTTTFNKDAAIELARALFSYKGTPWKEVARILRNLSEQDVEGIRYCILGYARSCLIGKEENPPNDRFAAKAFKVIDIFSRNFYDNKHAGLAAACWETVMTK